MKEKLAVAVLAKVSLWVSLCSPFTHLTTTYGGEVSTNLAQQGIFTSTGTWLSYANTVPRHESARLREQAKEIAEKADKLKECEDAEDAVVRALEAYKAVQ